MAQSYEPDGTPLGRNYILYAYCLMSNHIHLLIREREDTIGMAIKRIASSYVYYYNHKYSRDGHLESITSPIGEIDRNREMYDISYVMKHRNLSLCFMVGSFLLNEIMSSGNFGHYDSRYTAIDKKNRRTNVGTVLKRNAHFLKYMPDEVSCAPFWKLWHWCWRKRKGYL